MKDQPLPFRRPEPSKALTRYQKAGERLSRAALQQTQNPSKRHLAVVDMYSRKAEIAVLVEILIDKKLITLDEFLDRCADSMDIHSKAVERSNLSIIVPPGRG